MPHCVLVRIKSVNVLMVFGKCLPCGGHLISGNHGDDDDDDGDSDDDDDGDDD